MEYTKILLHIKEYGYANLTKKDFHDFLCDIENNNINDKNFKIDFLGGMWRVETI